MLILDFEQLMRVNEGNGYLKAVGNNGWQLLDQYEENIAYIEILKWQDGKGRIDFNPNKIGHFLASSMKNFIHDLFLEPHFSRADIACDIIDVPDEFITQYQWLILFLSSQFMGGLGSWKQLIGAVVPANDKFGYTIKNWNKKPNEKLYQRKLRLGGG